MTIAAAFNVPDGILFCTDTEGTLGQELKQYQRKIFFEKLKNASLVFAITGAVAHAKMAVQEIIESCRESDQRYETMKGIAKAKIHDIYSNHIYPHPLAPYGQGPSFDLLVAIWTEASGPKLLASWETAVIEPEVGYECKGSGEALARYLVGQFYGHQALSTNAAILLASLLLGNVKRSVPGCGGNNELCLLGNNGWISYIAPSFAAEQQTFGTQLEAECFKLLSAAGDLAMGDDKFEEKLSKFCAWMKGARKDACTKGLANLRHFLVPMGEFGV